MVILPSFLGPHQAVPHHLDTRLCFRNGTQTLAIPRSWVTIQTVSYHVLEWTSPDPDSI